MDAQEVRQFSSDDLTPEVLAMTLEEFLESDLEEYELLSKGEISLSVSYISRTWQN